MQQMFPQGFDPRTYMYNKIFGEQTKTGAPETNSIAMGQDYLGRIDSQEYLWKYLDSQGIPRPEGGYGTDVYGGIKNIKGMDPKLIKDILSKSLNSPERNREGQIEGEGVIVNPNDPYELNEKKEIIMENGKPKLKILYNKDYNKVVK
jgi:hypothetical protein